MLSKQTQFFLAYSAVSVLAVSFSIADALDKSNTYYAFIFRLTDGLNLGVMLNFALCCFILCSTMIQRTIFGEIRLIEREHIVERLPAFIINLVLNLTTRDRNLILNVALVMISLFSEVMHSILKDRLEFKKAKIMMEMSAAGFYDYKKVLKVYGKNVFMYWSLIFSVIDFVIAKYLVYDVFQGLNSVPCLLFGFKFAVKGLELLAILLKDSLDAYEFIAYPSHSSQEDDFDLDTTDLDNLDDELEDSVDRVWESKGYYVKSVDIVASVLKVVSYLTFIFLLGVHADSSIPISMLQGAFLSAKDTFQEVKRFVEFVKQARKLDDQLEDASKEDLESDSLCIICRDDMHSPKDFEEAHKKKLASRRKPKKISCGHILHMGCLKDWLERSDNCPLCRRKVFGVPNGPANTSQPPQAPTDTMMQQPEQLQRPRPPQDGFGDFPRPTGGALNHQHLAVNRRFQEFNDLLREHRPQRRSSGASADNSSTRTGPTPVPTPTTDEPTVSATPPVASTSARPSTAPSSTRPRLRFQEIDLPTNSLLPPGWKILPARLVNANEYSVNLSTNVLATMRVLNSPNGRELRLRNPNEFASVTVEANEATETDTQ